jgi:cation:H+ antiporter
MEYIWFLFSALLIVLAGNRLVAYGDTLAVHTSLGYSLVGGILIAGVTSLPELASSISAALIGAPDIAFGNVYGSNAFNLMILAIVDIYQGRGSSLLQTVRDSHILTAMFGILLTGISIMAIWMTPYNLLEFTVGWISSYSILLMVLYIFSAFLMIRYEERMKNQLPDKTSEPEVKVRITPTSRKYLMHAVIGFVIAGVVIVIAGILLSINANIIAEKTGLGQTFIGTLLVAGATSLPELVAAIAAIRIGAYDMAVGNVLGSNIFNILILVATDAAYLEGSVYRAVSTQHLITAITAIILSSIAVIGLFYRSKRTIWKLGWDSLAILIGYLAMLYVLFMTSII